MKPAFRTPAPADPDIRYRMLVYVKTRDRVFVRDVADQFHISHEGARKQLVHMERDGWLRRSPLLDGVGRPRDAYSVAEAGDHLLPKAYDKLSLAVLSALREAPADDVSGRPTAGVRDLIATLARGQVAAWKPRLEGMGTREKLEALKELYADGDPFTTLELGEKEALLVERNCPFLNAALEHPALCSLTVNTLEALLGHPVVREQRFQSGHGRCSFRVLLDRELKEGSFSLESERPSVTPAQG